MLAKLIFGWKSICWVVFNIYVCVKWFIGTHSYLFHITHNAKESFQWVKIMLLPWLWCWTNSRIACDLRRHDAHETSPKCYMLRVYMQWKLLHADLYVECFLSNHLGISQPDRPGLEITTVTSSENCQEDNRYGNESGYFCYWQHGIRENTILLCFILLWS